MNKYLIIICVVLGIVSTTLFSYVGKLKDEKERLSGNQQALMEKIEFTKQKLVNQQHLFRNLN